MNRYILNDFKNLIYEWNFEYLFHCHNHPCVDIDTPEGEPIGRPSPLFWYHPDTKLLFWHTGNDNAGKLFFFTCTEPQKYTKNHWADPCLDDMEKFYSSLGKKC